MQHFFPTTVIVCDCDISLIVTKTAPEPQPKPQPRKSCISAEGRIVYGIAEMLEKRGNPPSHL
jgi:hypothetical protein